MKKFLLFLAAITFITESYSQASFNTGAMEVNVNAYGRIRLFTPNGTRHLQRASILVGTSPTAVFDYYNDADELEPTVLVTNPAMSNYEIYGAYDNAYSGLPPAVIVKLNAYGWNSGAYTVVKFNIENDEASAINAKIGLDIIPELNQEYGYDTVTYNSEAGVIRFHRGNQMNMGIKQLSGTMSSSYSFEWYDGYPVDEDFWDWMNYGMLQPQYASMTEDGPVTITSQNAVTLNPGESADIYFALALGSNEQAMLNNMATAVEKYQTMLTGVDDKPSQGKALILEQNYPNPFETETQISYQLPQDGFVSLKVYDITGREVADLVNASQKEGKYTVQLNGTELNDGLYFCTLRLNAGVVRTMKIFKNR
jgi:hypothetical protein